MKILSGLSIAIGTCILVVLSLNNCFGLGLIGLILLVVGLVTFEEE